MYLLGHIGLTVFLAFVVEKYTKITLKNKKIFIGIGAMFPDFIDKPLLVAFHLEGRGIAHSLLGLSLLYFTGILVNELYIKKLEYRSAVNLIFIGCLAHLFEDMPSLPFNVIFWPFMGSIESTNPTDFLRGFENIVTVFSEIIGLILLVALGIMENWSSKAWYRLFGIVISYAIIFLSFYILLIGF